MLRCQFFEGRKKSCLLYTSKQDHETQKALRRLEKQIDQLTLKKKELQNRFENPNVTTEDLIKWSAELKTIEAELSVKEDEWMMMV